MATYVIQTVNKSRRIITFNVSRPFYVFLSVKYVADLIVKLGRRSVEAEESFQGTGSRGSHSGYFLVVRS